MRRGSLFFIALLSAIITFISLNIAFGRPGYYYEPYSYYHRYHHYYGRHYDERYDRNRQPISDSSNSNY